MIIVSAYHPIDSQIFEIGEDLHIIYKGRNNIEQYNLSSIHAIEWEPNIGSNMYTMARYILRNYNNLPQRLTFIKSNIFSRHITYGEFLKLYENKNCSLQTYHTRIFDDTTVAWQNGKWYCEQYNEWFENKFSHVRFRKIQETYRHFFNIEPPSYFRFSPGGNFSISKELILSRKVEFYQDIVHTLAGAVWPREAHFIERMIGDIFEPCV